MRRWFAATMLASVVLMTGCYSFKAGSFPPAHVKTISIAPFENNTNRFELSGEIYEQLLRNLPRALGIRTAGEELANAVVRGTVLRYEVAAPNYRAGQPGEAIEVLQRQVTITVSIEIVDLVENVILWEDKNVSAMGQFMEGTETEDAGRAEAILLLVQKIVDGAQSNW